MGFDADFAKGTDKYFLKTKEVVRKFGDKQATYAVFLRRPVIFAPRLMQQWIANVAKARGFAYQIDTRYAEGDLVGGGEPLLYILGPLYHLVDLETHYLQRSARRASPPTTPIRCVAICPRSRFSPWTRATAPAPRWRR